MALGKERRLPERSSETVLVLDDDPVLREVLSTQLRTAGFQVVAAACIADAVQLAMRMSLDQLLIDQRLGAEDGVHALARLRQTTGAKTARAIAITAELDDALRQQLADVGFDAALLKPVAMPVLLAVLSRASATDQIEPTQRDVVLDDAAALAIWGAMTTVSMLRAMLISELDPYRDALAQSCVRQDQPALREVLHRMRSSAGFCGAAVLTRFIDATTAGSASDWSTLLQRYDSACAELRPALTAAQAT